MCGFAGKISEATFDARSFVADAWSELARRGPDAQGYALVDGDHLRVGHTAITGGFSEVTLALAHTRLSILDTSVAGTQPMTFGDDSFVLVYNGEIYNFVELRADLERKGVHFRTHCDSEVLGHGLRLEGPGFLNRCIGMFALAFLDRRASEVTLARDGFGIKPLFYRQGRGFAAFGSTIAATGRGGAREAADRQAVFDFLRYGLTGHDDRTLVEGVREVEPGAGLVLSAVDGSTVRRFDIPFCDPTAPRMMLDPAGRLQSAFTSSIERHLRSDVPLAFALSGGIDSTSVLRMAEHLHHEGELRAFSYLPETQAISERRWVDHALVGSRALLHEVTPGRDRVVEALEAVHVAQGEPIASASVLASYFVYESVAAAGFKVLLNGQGADEVLGGYFTYQGVRLAELARKGQVHSFAKLFRSSAKLPGNSVALTAQMFAEYVVPPQLEERLRSIVGRPVLPGWFDPGYLETPSAHLSKQGKRSKSLQDQLRLEVRRNLPHLLRYDDRNAMYHSVESRVPFLDQSFVAEAQKLDGGQLINSHGVTKAAFRRAMAGVVPAPILARTDKVGFEADTLRWGDALESWIEGVLKETSTGDVSFVNATMSGHWSDAVTDPRARLRVASLCRWADRQGVRLS